MNTTTTFRAYLKLLERIVDARRGDVEGETTAYRQWLERDDPTPPQPAMIAIGPLLTGPLSFRGAPPPAPRDAAA